MSDDVNAMVPTPAPSAPPDSISTFVWDSPRPEERTKPDQVPEGFTLAHEADATYLDDVFEDVKSQLAEWDTEDDRALFAPDPHLAYLRGTVRPRLQPLLEKWDALAKTHFSDPNRRLYTEEGQRVAEETFMEAARADRAEVEQALATELDRLEDEAAAVVNQTSGIHVTAKHDGTALQLSTMLSRMTPAHGLPVLASFIRDAIKERGAAYAVLPVLRSMYDGMPGAEQWTRHVGLLRACNALKAIIDAVPGSAPAKARLERIQRTRGDLIQVLASARGDRQAMRMIDNEGRLVLFPDAPTPRPREPEPEPPPYAGRRLRVSAAQRASDERERQRRAALQE